MRNKALTLLIVTFVVFFSTSFCYAAFSIGGYFSGTAFDDTTTSDIGNGAQLSLLWSKYEYRVFVEGFKDIVHTNQERNELNFLNTGLVFIVNVKLLPDLIGYSLLGLVYSVTETELEFGNEWGHQIGLGVKLPMKTFATSKEIGSNVFIEYCHTFLDFYPGHKETEYDYGMFKIGVGYGF